MKKYLIEIKWAVLFTIIAMVWMVFEKSMGWHDEMIADHPMYTMLFMIPAILLYIIALRDKRDNQLGGKMTWMQAFISGTIISLIIAILSPLSQWITHTYITPDYFDNAIQYSVENHQYTLEAANKYFSLSSYIIQSTAWAFFAGLITSAIVALFVRKK